MSRFTAYLAVLSSTLILTGCALFQSPAVGDWSGKMTTSASGGVLGAIATTMTTTLGDPSAHLTLKSDGTGYLKVMVSPERPITWKADGDRILLYGMDTSTNTTSSTTSSDNSIVGRLSEDKKSLNFDLGPVQFNLTKETK